MLNIKEQKLNAQSHAPKYIQLKNILKEMLKQMEPGKMLPSENQLAKQFDVHRLTSRQAITELVKEGIIYREHGKGSFVAQKVKQQNSKNIACLFRRLRAKQKDDNFFLEIFEGFEDEITENDCFMIYRSFVSDTLPEKEFVLKAANKLLATDISALVFDERISDATIKKLLPHNKKMAVVNRKSELKNVLSAYPDNKAYARKILEYVCGLNHKKLLYIYELEIPNQLQLLKYLKTECESFGLSPENIHVKAARETSFSGAVYRDAVLEGINEFAPTVIIAGFDWIANNVYAQLSEMGISIPNDMSVMSVGDFAIASRLSPPLTTLRIDANKIGRSTAKLVLGNHETDILLEPELIERGSCAKI
jgi:GntR family transcriptional regulator, arabinose operon transcriptional repressor